MMKKWSALTIYFSAGLLIAGLIACSQDDAPATEGATLSPTEAAIQESSATSTNEPSIMPTATLTPVAAQSSTPTTMPPLRPSATSTPSVSPTGQGVPLPQGNHSYQLQRPAIENVVSAVTAFNAQMPLANYAGGLTPHVPDLVHNQLAALSLLIGNDIQQYHTAGFSVDPDFLNLMLAEQGFAPSSFFTDGDSGLILLTQQALANYFAAPLPERQAQDREWQYVLTAVELDGDTQTEWVAEINIPGLNLFQYLPMEGNEADGYQIIPNRLPVYSQRLGDLPKRIIPGIDLTGDGVPELIIEELFEGPAHYNYGLKIFTWSGSELYQIGIDERYGSSLIFRYYPLLEIVDVTGDTVSDIQITWSYHDNYNCVWDRVDIFSWQGQQRHHQISSDAPDTPFCNINTASYTSPLADRIPLLERALSQLTVSDIESADLAAFVRTHLAFAYASQYQDQQAANILNSLDTLSGEATYAQLVQTEYKSSAGSSLALCRQLRTKGDVILDTNIGQYVNRWVTSGSQDGGDIPDLYHICPLQKLAQERLQTMGNLSAQQSPPDGLAASDIDLAFAQPVNIDQDEAEEWIGILEPLAPELLIFDAVNGMWQSYVVDLPLFNPVFDLQIEVRDLVGDEVPEIITAVQGPDGYELFVIAAVDNSYQQISSCCFTFDELPVLSELDQDFFRLSPQGPEWVALVGFGGKADDLWDFISQLTDAVVAGERPSSLSEEITTLINYLPSNDPDARLVIAYLTYLLGYTHELNCRDQLAIDTYLALIEQAPSSPWSWLAWSRLEIVPDE